MSLSATALVHQQLTDSRSFYLYHLRSLARSTQGFQQVPSAQKNQDMVGRPVMHLSAPQQATGEARYKCLHNIKEKLLQSLVIIISGEGSLFFKRKCCRMLGVYKVIF